MVNNMKKNNAIKELIFNIGWYTEQFFSEIDFYFWKYSLNIFIILAVLSTISLIVIAIKL